jgi:hypothetical protein
MTPEERRRRNVTRRARYAERREAERPLETSRRSMDVLPWTLHTGSVRDLVALLGNRLEAGVELGLDLGCLLRH